MGQVPHSSAIGSFYAAAAEPAVAPAPVPAAAPQHAAPEPPKRRVWMIVASVVILAVVAIFFFVERSRQATRTTTSVVRTATAERRDLVRSIRLNGTVEATQSYVVSAPSQTGGGFSTLIITKLAKAGSAIHKGDVLVEFDMQTQVQNALDRRADYLDLEEQIKKKIADQAAQRAKDDTELKQAEDSLKAWQFEVQRNEVLSKIDAEKNNESLEEAKAKLAELRNTYDLKRKAARSDLRILEIQRDRARNAMLHAENNAKKGTIVAPGEGVVVLNTIWKNGQMAEVAEGDEVRTGVPFMQVMNPNAMQVRARVNQADAVLMRVGAPVTVRLDAYPSVALPGRLERLAAIGNTSNFSNKVRTFTAVFSITGSLPQLMPDLTAAADVELSRVAGALVVPRDAIVTEKDASFVYVKSGSGFHKQPVHVGATSDTDAALDSGLTAGDVVLRSPERQRGGN